MLDALNFLHQRFGYALAIFAFLLGVWGSYEFIRHRRLSGGFRSSYLLMILLTAVQGLLGLVALLLGGRPHELLHIVYGVFALAALPGVFVYVARRPPDQEAAFLAATCWVVLVAFGRGITTGAP